MSIRRTKPKHQCGLCGATKKLTKTECCQQWICNDEDNYVPFSYGHNSCHRNHRRYTLCGYHHTEEHKGPWQGCEACKEDFEIEVYVHYGTNDYNFERLKDPPNFEPTHCATCKKVIKLGEGGYSMKGEKYWCPKCTRKSLPQSLRR